MNAQQKLRSGFDSLYDNHPFISSILARWNVQSAQCLPGATPDPDKPFVIATDGVRLLYNPDEIEPMLIGDVAWILLHEAGHVFLGHHLRAGTRHPLVWNIASDLALNELIRQYIPRNSVHAQKSIFATDPQFGFEPDKSAEFYYSALMQKFQDQLPQPEPQTMPSPQSDTGDDKQGDNNTDGNEKSEDSDSDEGAGEGDAADSGEHGPTGMGAGSDTSGDGDDSDGGHPNGQSSTPGDPGKNADNGSKTGQSGLDQWAAELPQPTGDVFEPADMVEARKRGGAEFEAVQDEQEGQWQHVVAQGMAAAEACGSIPAWLAQQMEQMFGHDPEHDAKNLLKRFMTLAYRSRYTFDRPARRSCHRKDIILPAKHSRGGGKGLVIVDTSGSMTEKECETAFVWIEDVVRDFPGAKITIAQCDTRLIEESIQDFDRHDFPLKVPPTWWGRGGTNLAPAFEWAKQNPGVYKWIAVVSDMMWSYDDSPDPGTPTIWLSTRYKPENLHYGDVPFGQCIGPTMEQYR